MDDVAVLRSDRLELISLAPAFVRALLAGRRRDAELTIDAAMPPEWPDEHDARFLRIRADQMERDPDARRWLVRAVVLRSARPVMVGHAGFHGPPGVNGAAAADAVEVGYTIFPPYRRRGYATEVAATLLAWARREEGVRHFIASVGPENAPSLAIVRKLGFTQTGEQWDDEDGLELVFERLFD